MSDKKDENNKFNSVNPEEDEFEFKFDDGHIESIGEFISPDELFEDLIRRVRKYHPSDDISLIEKAYRVADEAHHEANVFLTLCYGDSTVEEICVPMVESKGIWYLR